MGEVGRLPGDNPSSGCRTVPLSAEPNLDDWLILVHLLAMAPGEGNISVLQLCNYSQTDMHKTQEKQT